MSRRLEPSTVAGERHCPVGTALVLDGSFAPRALRLCAVQTVECGSLQIFQSVGCILRLLVYGSFARPFVPRAHRIGKIQTVDSGRRLTIQTVNRIPLVC